MQNKPKIAVCIAGEIRTGIEDFKVFSEFFKHYDIDVFVHTWNVVTSDNLKFGEDIWKGNEGYDTKGTQQKIAELYKPVRMLVEDPLEKTDTLAFESMMYSIYRADLLRQDYELETNKIYDIVVKYRFDLIFEKGITFPPFQVEPRTLYYVNRNQGCTPQDCGRHGLSDLWFYGDSNTMSTVCSMYNFFRYKLKPLRNPNYFTGVELKRDMSFATFSPSQLYYNQCIKYNIRPVDISMMDNNYNRQSLHRTTVKHLDPYDNFKEINEYYNSHV